MRLDQYLVQQGHTPSRTKAAELISEGRVSVNGSVVEKASTKVMDTDVLHVNLPEVVYVSRAGHKLAGALARFPQINVENKICLDAGASTGGFTQVLLEAGAQKVHAVDVGHGQLVEQLREDERAVVYERQNIRTIDTVLEHGSIDVVVSDLSFISLTLVLAPLRAVCSPEAHLLLMVKPQFEVGKNQLGKGGVVTDPQLRANAVQRVVSAADAEGLVLQGVGRSQLPGQDGNVEFFCWFTPKTESSTGRVDSQRLLETVDYH